MTAPGAPRVPKPLFRDPVLDGAADPTVIWNRAEGSWWLLYTARRAVCPPLDDVAWVHGSDIGVASSKDGGLTWTYRGAVTGLATAPGHHTYWAPEVLDDGERYHMYVSFIEGVPSSFEGHPREIRHYTSHDLFCWEYVSTLDLTSHNVIDACIYGLPGGGYRLWYKDEANSSHTYAADSDDLHRWRVAGPAVEVSHHEGPNVFALGGWYWMLVDEWAGLRVLRSDDLESWEPQDRILDVSGTGEDDRGLGYHADVVVVGEDAFVFYFTHPGRAQPTGHSETDHEARRSSVQVARAHLVDGRLVCDRDEVLTGPFLPLGGPALDAGSGRPEVVTLCGSTRFRDAFEREQRRLTLEGRIVLSVGMFGHEEGLDETSQVKVDLDQLHLRKIDLSQRVHVINAGGYIGSSTSREIAYAQQRGIPVTYLEP